MRKSLWFILKTDVRLRQSPLKTESTVSDISRVQIPIIDFKCQEFNSDCPTITDLDSLNLIQYVILPPGVTYKVQSYGKAW